MPCPLSCPPLPVLIPLPYLLEVYTILSPSICTLLDLPVLAPVVLAGGWAPLKTGLLSLRQDCYSLANLNPALCGFSLTVPFGVSAPTVPSARVSV